MLEVLDAVIPRMVYLKALLPDMLSAITTQRYWVIFLLVINYWEATFLMLFPEEHATHLLYLGQHYFNGIGAGFEGL